MADRLYNLLPANLRTRDAQQGQPLRALISVLEEQLDAVIADTDTTWDNWFIETCEEWLVPYIGEQLGVRGMRSIAATGFSQRAFVANNIAYRRRKGTAAVVEQLARDVTGYPARVVEYFKHTVITPHMRHVPEAGLLPAHGGTIDLRVNRDLARLGTAFDPQAHTADVRHIASGRGRYNLPHLGIFLWRVQSQEVSAGNAAPVGGATGWYRFHPLGWDAPLFNLPKSETEIEALATEANVPHPLRRRDLFDQQRGTAPQQDLGDDPAIVVRTEKDGILSDPWTMQICDLSDIGGALPTKRPPTGVVAVDPDLGRLVFAVDDVPTTGTFEVLVDYCYGSAGEIGAGPFDRTSAHEAQRGDDELTFIRGVSRATSGITSGSTASVVTTLEQAVRDWNDYVGALSVDDQASAVGAIALLDSRTYAAPTSTLTVPAGARLHLVGGGISGDTLDSMSLLTERTRPIIRGDLVVRGTATAGSRARTGGVFLNGLTLSGKVVVEAGDLERLDMAHTTLPPVAETPSIDVRVGSGLSNAALEIRVYRCQTGGIASAGPITAVEITDSLIDGPLAISGATLAISAATILGDTRARTLSASDSIFDGAVDIEQHQEGCLRFCYAPGGQRTPRRYRCQPDLTLAGINDASARARILARVRPRLVARTPSAPAYGQLAGATELLTAAENGAEIGVFHHLAQALREANLRAALRQHLRFGLEAGILLES